MQQFVPLDLRTQMPALRITCVGEFSHLFTRSDRTHVRRIIDYLLNYNRRFQLFLYGDVVTAPFTSTDRQYAGIGLLAAGSMRQVSALERALLSAAEKPDVKTPFDAEGMRYEVIKVNSTLSGTSFNLSPQPELLTKHPVDLTLVLKRDFQQALQRGSL